MKEQVLDATKIVLVTFLFTAAIIPVIKKIAIHVGAIDVPRADEGHRHIHKKATPMLGGVGIFLGFLFGYMLFGEQSIVMNSVLIASFVVIIIGVFDENSHGQSGQNLVKIIRNDSIGGLAWHKSNTNDWTQASLMNLLNGAYLNSENGTGGEYCYGYSTTVGAQCDYTETGINDTYRAMIENVTWYLGGYSSYSATTGAFYGYERGTTVYSGRPTTWEEQIGLMYPSDYGYSVLASSCARTTNLGSYDNATCAGQSWLYGQGYEWTITPDSSRSNSVFYVYYYGRLRYSSASIGFSARPVLYLDSSVYVIDGNGSQSDPYIIGM